MEQVYGLIGATLKHSFSKKYFSEKFARENLEGYTYALFELKQINEFPALLAAQPGLRGLNVTIPYKQAIIAFLDNLHPSAKKVGAVNVVKFNADGSKTGFNSDYFGFKLSLQQWIAAGTLSTLKAVILGAGGAAKAVIAALEDIDVPYIQVSRTAAPGIVDYATFRKSQILSDRHLIIHTTPLGMFPLIEDAPDLDYSQISSHHFVYDLVYNPEQSRLMELCALKGARVKNGLEMLHLQAEKAWEIWNA